MELPGTLDVTIDVTQDHIDRGAGGNSRRCAGALALRAAAPELGDLELDRAGIAFVAAYLIYRHPGGDEAARYRAELGAFRLWVVRFDLGADVEPVTVPLRFICYERHGSR